MQLRLNQMRLRLVKIRQDLQANQTPRIFMLLIARCYSSIATPAPHNYCNTQLASQCYAYRAYCAPTTAFRSAVMVCRVFFPSHQPPSVITKETAAAMA